MKVHNLLVTGSLTSGGENIGSISSSVATINNAQDGRLSSLETTSGSIISKTGSYATTGSNVFVGNQTISGSIVPSVNGTYDLGSSTHEFRHLYLSSASLYIDGTKVLGSTTQELQITTDTGQSFKILEADSDTITLQAADGNITLATSGGGDVILDPTTGVIALKGTTTLYAGNRLLSSDGNAIQIGNSATITGSLIVTGYIETQELRTTYISSSILYRSGSTKFGDELSDTHTFTGSLLVSGSVTTVGPNVFTSALTGTSATLSSTLKVGGATGNFLIDGYTTSKIGMRSWTDISGTTNNFFLQNSASYNYGIVGVVSASGTATGDVYGLGYSPSAGTSMTPVINWTSNGKVGIGNTDPLSPLHIGGALASSGDAAAITLKQTGTNETTGIYLERSGERKGYAIYVGGSLDSLVFQRNNAGTKSDVLTLTRDGNVGINQSDPSGLGGPSFVVAGSGYPEVIVEKTGANARKWGFTVGSDGSYLLRDYTSGANVFTVSTAGVGNFNSAITVGGNTVWTSANDGSGSGLDADLLDGRDSGGYMTQTQGGIEFQQGSYTGWYKLARSSQAPSGAGLRGSFKIIVAATGNYLTPSQDEITGFKDWTTNATISSIASSADSIFQNYRITYDADYSYLEGYVSYYFGGSQDIVINSYVNGLNGLTWSPYTGTVQASSTSNGAVSIGKVNNGFTVPYLRSAGGVKFGSGSSTLNYYEEGTFTPSNLNSNMSSVTPTWGRYVRVGSQVTINVRWAVEPGGTGQKYIVFNLPFAFNNTSNISYTGAVSNYNNGLSSNSSNVGTSVRNSSSSDTQQYVEAVFTTNASTTMLFSMTYFTF
jgi:hypothetical protein